MAKRKKAKTVPPAQPDMAPTTERLARSEWRRAGMAHQSIPSLDKLKTSGVLSDQQYDALTRYAALGIACERSPVRSNCDFSVRGGGDGPPFATRARIELAPMEAALGSLVDVARAIAIDGHTLNDWAMAKGGAIERRKPGIKQAVIVWFEPHRTARRMAIEEIRMAGERLAAAQCFRTP